MNLEGKEGKEGSSQGILLHLRHEWTASEVGRLVQQQK